MAGKGRITAHELNGVLGSNIDTSALLCTDSATNYKTFAKMKGLQHEAINVRKGTYVRKRIYHIQHVNSYHRRFKEWMNRFQGVATRYLDNYLFWYRFLELHKKMPKKEKVKYMLLQTCRKVNFTTVETFRTV